ncbi:MAG: hypothetical protein J6S83_09790 [Lachnospiraceae bacterium]|nr:hypothetical protein [Lachnospiraceae bacterium]
MEEKRKDPKEKKCAICGKDIYAGEEWAYKRREKSERTKWFCSYKCMRQYDAKHGPKQARPVGLPADLDAAAPKEPVSRAVVAKALAKEIKRGGSVIAYLKAEGYKNPYQAYDAVRHYCETKMPEMAEVLKPLKDLPKGPQQKTGRPRKSAEVVTVDKVPSLEELEDQVAEVLNLQGGVNYQLQVDETMKAEVKPFGGGFHYQGFKVTGIETSFGRFDWNVERTLITFTYEDEEINILPGDWKKMAEHLPEILDVLGVTGK